MSNIKQKLGTDSTEGLRLSFNFIMYSDLCNGPNGYRYLEKKLQAGDLARNWFKNNLEGLPEQAEPIPPGEILGS